MQGASSEFDVFARYYDLEHGEYLEDVPLYRSYAERTGSPVLEIGCGTGRILLPLARGDIDVTGVDVSPAMLARAAEKTQRAGLDDHVRLVHADARRLQLGREYRMAILGLNSFMHFLTRADQLAVLESARRHLAAHGILIIDLFSPGANLTRDVDGQLIHEWVRPNPDSEGVVVKYASRQLDEAAQLIHVTWFYQAIDSAGSARWTVLPFSVRYYHRAEMELLLEQAGYRVERVFGSYELEDYSDGSPRLILVAQPRPIRGSIAAKES